MTVKEKHHLIENFRRAIDEVESHLKGTDAKAWDFIPPIADAWPIRAQVAHLLDADMYTWARIRKSVAQSGAAVDVWDQEAWAARLDYERADVPRTLDHCRIVRDALAGKDYFIDGKGSSRRIVPELQTLAAGDELFLAPGLGFRVERLEPNRLLLLLAGDPDTVAEVNAGAPMPSGYAATSWLFSLKELEGGRTRILSRFRGRNASAGPVGDFLWNLVGGIGGAVIQQPAMFAGLRARSEGRIER